MKHFLARIMIMAFAAILMPLATPAQADDLDKVKAMGELSVAMEGQYPPFNFVNDQNQVVGFDASIAGALAERLGVKLKIVTTVWDGIIAGLLAQKYDIIVGSMSITPEREKSVDFVGPYYHAGRAVFVRTDSTIQNLTDLKGKKLGVTFGETHDKWARDQSKAHGGWTVRAYKGLPEVLMELKAGRVDAIVMDNIPVMAAIKETGEKFRALDTPDIEDSHVPVGIALRKNNPALKAALQQALDAMMRDGRYEKISLEWFGRDIR